MTAKKWNRAWRKALKEWDKAYKYWKQHSKGTQTGQTSQWEVSSENPTMFKHSGKPETYMLEEYIHRKTPIE